MSGQRDDVLRQVAVVLATVLMLLAAIAGVGLLGGTPVHQLQDGALAADATVLAPAAPAFRIWSAVYLGLIAYAVWQALPSQRDRERHRRLGWWVALTEVLNGAWLLAAQFAPLVLTVVAIAALLAALCVLFERTRRVRREGRLDALLLDGVTGLHLGWVSVATAANTAAWLDRLAPAQDAGAANAWGVAVLGLVALVGCALGWRSGGRIAPALALAWGLAWIAVGRLAGEPASATVGVAAILAGVAILAVTLGRRASARRRAIP